jgi:hypothetical protein
MPSPTPFDSPPAPAASCLECIVGGTLALLTHYARMPDLAVSDRIACNLALIARHPEASSALRSVCVGLFTDWLRPLQVQDAPTGSEWRDVWPMPPATQ